MNYRLVIIKVHTPTYQQAAAYTGVEVDASLRSGCCDRRTSQTSVSSGCCDRRTSQTSVPHRLGCLIGFRTRRLACRLLSAVIGNDTHELPFGNGRRRNRFNTPPTYQLAAAAAAAADTEALDATHFLRRRSPDSGLSTCRPTRAAHKGCPAAYPG